MSLTVSRRTFLTGAAAAAVSQVPPAGAATLKDLARSKFDETVDVLVVGGGIAGLSAALLAKESGAGKVLLIEKGSYLGGHALISGGGYVACGTQLQKDAGIEDSWENCWEDAVKRGREINGIFQRDDTVCKLVFQKQTEGLEWLQKHGVKFEPKIGYGYGNAKRRHFFAPKGARGNTAAMQALARAAEEAGVEIRTRTRLTRLVTDGQAIGSTVTGIVAEAEGPKQLLIGSRGGVILACGGFGADPEMVRHYHPYLDGIIVLGSPLVTGDGFKAAAELGVPMQVTHNDLGGTFACVEYTSKTQRVSSSALVNIPIVIVTEEGKRFINESVGSRYVTSDMTRKGIRKSFWIIDGKHAEETKNNWLKGLQKKGLIREYPSIAELAKGEGINAENLEATIAQYNKDVPTGRDSVFGREKLFQAVDTAPYLVVSAAPSILYTYSGVEIDTETRVLNTMHRPVPGLFAAGDTSGRCDGVLGLGQGGCSGLSVATVTGRIAGEQAAEASRRGR